MASKGYAPADMTPGDVIDTARRHDLVIVATGASGVTHSFVTTGVPDRGGELWSVRCELRSGQSTTWLTNPEYEDTLRNCIRRCDPDVRLVEERESTFGGDSDDA